MIHILLSNDDGYLAPGLLALYEALLPLAKITVVAPEQNHSGASNSLTLQRPLSIQKAQSGAQSGFLYINGTPTDCVHIALTSLLEQKPDLVVSGINQGANMGEDVFYSGTVAAAIEGMMFGIPAFAFSQDERGWKNLDSGARVARDIIERYLNNPVPPTVGTTLLNVNIPSCSYSELKGFSVTRLGKRHPSQPVLPQTNPRGEKIYWIGAAGEAKDASHGTDFHAVYSRQVSLTPLQLDLTNHRQFTDIQHWITHV